MKEINDKEFDMLISESFARENTLQDIEISVTKSSLDTGVAVSSLLCLFCHSYSVACCSHILYIRGFKRPVS